MARIIENDFFISEFLITISYSLNYYSFTSDFTIFSIALTVKLCNTESHNSMIFVTYAYFIFALLTITHKENYSFLTVLRHAVRSKENYRNKIKLPTLVIKGRE